MNKPMRYWNGRDQLGIHGPDSHTYICARSKAEALRLGQRVFGGFTKTELNVYFSECWGTTAQEVLGLRIDRAIAKLLCLTVAEINMKLSVLCEARNVRKVALPEAKSPGYSRRKFLKFASAAASGPAGLLKAALGSGANSYLDALELYKGLDSKQRAGVKSLVGELTVRSVWGRGLDFGAGGLANAKLSSTVASDSSVFDIRDGVVRIADPDGMVSFPLRAAVGWQLDNTDLDRLDDVNHDWVAMRDVWDAVGSNIVDDILTTVVKNSGGLAGFLKKLRNSGADHSSKFWESFLKHPLTRGLGIGPDDAQKLQFDNFDAGTIRRMEQRGLLSRDQAKEKVQGWSGDRDDLEWEKEREKRTESDKFVAPHDYKIAAPMHQHFESKLANALQIE